MTKRSMLDRIAQNDSINFFVTNRVPRRLLTLFMGWVSRVENPLLCRVGIWLWRRFTVLDLSEAKNSNFRSLHDCFTRELKVGARPINMDPALLTSPCDALVGACGRVRDGMVLQAKDSEYSLLDLLCDTELVRYYRDGQYATLRLTSAMYHRFHAPYDCRVKQVNYLAGDAWNVNPAALRRVRSLFCKNERAVVSCLLPSGAIVTLVPVAAILVASIRLRFVDVRLHLRYRGPTVIPCDAVLNKGEEMGWFEHGSTIIVFAPPGTVLADFPNGAAVRMGEAIMRLDCSQRGRR